MSEDTYTRLRSSYLKAVRAKLGDALRHQMPVPEALPAELIVLLRELNTIDRRSLEKVDAAHKTKGRCPPLGGEVPIATRIIGGVGQDEALRTRGE